VLTNELLCYSSATLAAAAALHYHTGDISEAIEALYRLGRTLLRSPSRIALERAAALVLCLALSEGAPELVCAPSVADGSLVSRKTIAKLLLKIETVLAFPGIENRCRLSHRKLLEALVELPNIERLVEFAKLCEVDELSEFCVSLIGSSGAALARLLALDKRKWNFKLHLDVLTAFLRQREDPPVWLSDAMMENALAQLIDICSQFRRGDILEDVFAELQCKEEPISRYLTPLLEQARVFCAPKGYAVIDDLAVRTV
jgi:hypothetical protein